MVRKTKAARGRTGAEAGRLIAGLEGEFDLMRLAERRAELEREDARLAGRQEAIRRSAPSSGRWWRAPISGCAVLWLDARRARLAERQRWCRLLEGDIEFGLRVSGLRVTGADDDGARTDVPGRGRR